MRRVPFHPLLHLPTTFFPLYFMKHPYSSTQPLFSVSFPLRGAQCANAFYRSPADHMILRRIAEQRARRFRLEASDLGQELYLKLSKISEFKSNDHARRLAWRLSSQVAVDMIRRRKIVDTDPNRPADAHDVDGLRTALADRWSLNHHDESVRAQRALAHLKDRLERLARAEVNPQERQLVALLKETGGQATQQSLALELGVTQSRISKILRSIRSRCQSAALSSLALIRLACKEQRFTAAIANMLSLRFQATAAFAARSFSL